MTQFILPVGMPRAFAPFGGCVMAPVGICPLTLALLLCIPLGGVAEPRVFVPALFVMTWFLSRCDF